MNKYVQINLSNWQTQRLQNTNVNFHFETDAKPSSSFKSTS